MSVLVWALFIFLSIAEGYIAYRFVKQRETVLLKAALPAYLLFAAFLLIAQISKLRLPDAAVILAMVSVFSHTFLGYYLKLYERVKYFDRGNHAFGCFSFSQLAYFTLTALFSEAIPRLLAAIIIMSLGVTLGAFVEIAELVSDSSKKKGKVQMQKGLRDTDFDLVFNVTGSAAAGVFAYFVML